MVDRIVELLPAIVSALATVAIAVVFGGAIVISHPGLFK